MLVELIVATVVLSLALLAVMAGYDSAFISMHKAAQKSAAATLAQNQLELYSAMSYSTIGLDTTTLSAVKTGNATYAADESGLDNAANATDATYACGSATNCLPVQTVTGSDKKSYTMETFIRDVSGISYSSRSERIVTIIMRDPNSTTDDVVAQMSATFDAGPST